MRSLRLARVALQAEHLRLRHMLRRQAVRVMLGAAAGVFLLAALAALHVAAVLALAEHVALIEAVLIVAAADLVLAVVLALFAARDVPSEVEREALALRRSAADQAVTAALELTLLGRLLRLRSLRDIAELLAAALAAWGAAARR